MSSRSGHFGTLMIVVSLAAPMGFAQTSASSAAACQSLMKLQLPGVTLTVTKTE